MEISKSMRLLSSLLFLCLFADLVFAETMAPNVKFVREGQVQELRAELQQEAIEDILSTLKATGYDSSKYAGNKNEWDKLASGSYFILSFPAPKQISIGEDSVTVDEILLPVSQDNHYLVRNTRLGAYRAFTKMHPLQRAKLVCRKEFLIEKNRSFCNYMKERDS